MYDRVLRSFFLESHTQIQPCIHPDDNQKIVDKIIELKKRFPYHNSDEITYNLYRAGFVPVTPARMHYMCSALVVLGAIPSFGVLRSSSEKMRKILALKPFQPAFKQNIFYPGLGEINDRQTMILNEALNIKALCRLPLHTS